MKIKKLECIAIILLFLCPAYKAMGSVVGGGASCKNSSCLSGYVCTRNNISTEELCTLPYKCADFQQGNPSGFNDGQTAQYQGAEYKCMSLFGNTYSAVNGVAPYTSAQSIWSTFYAQQHYDVYASVNAPNGQTSLKFWHKTSPQAFGAACQTSADCPIALSDNARNIVSQNLTFGACRSTEFRGRQTTQ